MEVGIRADLGSAGMLMLVPAAGGEKGYRLGTEGRIERMDERVSLPPGSSWAAKSYPVLRHGGRVRPRSMSFRPPNMSIRQF